MENKKIVVGLTGGIASGKSAVSRKLFSLGACIVDADIVSRKVVENGSEGDRQMRAAFPLVYCDGVLDRCKLRKLVFDNSIERDKLNAITHPLIEKECIKEVNESDKSVVVLVAPLLFETKFNLLTDCVITVSSDTNARILRLMARDGVDEKLARSMIDAQLSDMEREKLADYVIYNNTTLKELENQAEKIYSCIKSKIS